MTESQNALDAGLTIAELVESLPVSSDGTSVTGVQVTDKVFFLVVNGDLAPVIMQRVLAFVGQLHEESHAAAPDDDAADSADGSSASA